MTRTKQEIETQILNVVGENFILKEIKKDLRGAQVILNSTFFQILLFNDLTYAISDFATYSITQK
jgi:hypothetical protein